MDLTGIVPGNVSRNFQQVANGGVPPGMGQTEEKQVKFATIFAREAGGLYSPNPANSLGGKEIVVKPLDPNFISYDA